ncbi:cupin domain-containing protein [Plasticicumulans acidivorans]|uniref:Quercetin dioxygenase-like cupin family protein n=1 Tax=Plasticicumulans acidivorans TaxID=886464 RepID=A0A317MV41_9GAMM|nr:cupin domain-containing protein [Plasticicumulans acidivorans]PWV62215.1 quercetin dioxygenase-like cupin family protein [Plasticicumulans acidivorans]
MSHPSASSPSLPAVMTIRRAGSGIVPVAAGMMSGPFLIQSLFPSEAEGEMTALRVFAAPGAVSHWHAHPCGQILFVVDGVGRVQREGGEISEVRAGDCIWFAANERHWHGAAPGSPFSYLSVQPVKDGRAVQWFEPVAPDGFARTP